MTTDFGTCLSCVDDLTPEMAVVSGSRVVAEALARRLTTRPGQLIDDPNYGYDLRDLLSSGVTQNDLARIPGMVRNECRKDQRVRDVQVSSNFDRASHTLTLSLSVATTAGPFSMTLSISDVTVQLLQVGPVTT